jgi:hypothetical protein
VITKCPICDAPVYPVKMFHSYCKDELRRSHIVTYEAKIIFNINNLEIRFFIEEKEFQIRNWDDSRTATLLCNGNYDQLTIDLVKSLVKKGKLLVALS